MREIRIHNFTWGLKSRGGFREQWDLGSHNFKFSFAQKLLKLPRELRPETGKRGTPLGGYKISTP